MSSIHAVFGAATALGSAIVRKLAAEAAGIRAVVRDAARAGELLREETEANVADARDTTGPQEAARHASVV